MCNSQQHLPMKFSDKVTKTGKWRGNSVEFYLQKWISLLIKHIIWAM